MPQALLGIAKSREVCLGSVGPPKEPLGLRVSAMRQGVIGMKRAGLGGNTWTDEFTVSVTDTVCGLLVASGASTEIVPVCGPSPRPAGLTDTVKSEDAGVRVIHGTFALADQENAPPLLLATPMDCAAGSAPPVT